MSIISHNVDASEHLPCQFPSSDPGPSFSPTPKSTSFNSRIILLFIISSYLVGLINGSYLWLALLYFVHSKVSPTTPSPPPTPPTTPTPPTPPPLSRQESVEWLNFIFRQVWSLLSPEVCVTLIDQIEDSLGQASKALGFINNVKVRDFELGKHSPRIHSVQLYESESGQDSILLDCTIEISPIIHSRTPQGLHLLLDLDVGSSTFGSISVPVLVQQTSFQALARIKVKFGSKPPFAKQVDVSFLAPPKLSLSIKPLKLINVMSLPVIDNFILNSIMNGINSLIVTPNIFSLNLEQILTGQEISTDVKTVGILKVIIHEAIDLRRADVLHENDTYCTISLQAGKPLARTRILPAESHPVWHETHYILVTDDDIKTKANLTIGLWDHDEVAPDDLLGRIKFSLSKLTSTPIGGWYQVKAQESSEVMVKAGYLKCEVGWYPKVSPTSALPTSHHSGILAVYVHQATDLSLRPRDKLHEFTTAYAQVYLSDKKIYQTRSKPHNPSPYWNASTEVFVRDYTKARLRVVIKEERPREHDPVIGTVVIDVSKCLDGDASRNTQWYTLEGGIGFGKVRISLALRLVTLEEPPTQLGYNLGVLLLDEIKLYNILPILDKSRDIFVTFRMPMASDTDDSKKSTNYVSPSSTTSFSTDIGYRVISRYQSNVKIQVYRRRRTGFPKLLASSTLFLSDLQDSTDTYITLPLYTTHHIDRPIHIPFITDIDTNQDMVQDPDTTLVEEELTTSMTSVQDSQQDDQWQRYATLQRGSLALPSTPIPSRRQRWWSGQSELHQLNLESQEYRGTTSESYIQPSTNVATIQFKAIFLPGLAWIENLRSGEEYEMKHYDSLPQNLKEDAERRRKRRQRLQSFLHSPGAMISSAGELVAAQRDDKLLPGTHLTRSLAWFMDGMIDKSVGLVMLPEKLIPSARRRHHVKEVPIEE